MLKVFFLFFIVVYLQAKENKIIESHSKILFEYKQLDEKQTNVALKTKFNNAVLYLEQKKYRKAIKLFKQTQSLLKVPSFLNIGIAYYKLNSQNNAYLYLKKIYDVKEASYFDSYSYMSAAYYLYKITNNKNYINEIIKIASKKKRLPEHTKRLVVDVYIELKQYKKALNLLLNMRYQHNLKIALLYIKIRKYNKAILHLNKALHLSTTDELTNKILWLKTFANLKANNFSKLVENIADIQKRIRIFKTNLKMPLKLYFNKNKFTAKEYFDMVTKFDTNRKIDFIFYFAPFVFADNDAINTEESKAFILKDKAHIQELDSMIEYNAKFIELIKKDPIYRTMQLKKLLEDKYDTQSYEYYNLGLSYAQCDDFHNAYKYFKKAYRLDKGNKLYATMTLLSATRVRIFMKEDERKSIVKNILSTKGTYVYFGQYAYNIVYGVKLRPDNQYLYSKFKKSIFFRALYFLDNIEEKGISKEEPLLYEFSKDPLVYMFNLVAREKGENDYQYISRLQDTIPTKYNSIFIKGPLVITRYYLDILKALGMIHVADLNIETDTSATYYRTKALVQLYDNNPKSTISIIEYLQQKYKIEDRYTYLLLIAAMIAMDDMENAFVTLALAQQILQNDVDINFLIGLRFLQELKMTSALKYLKNKYNAELIDFKLVGFDKLLKEL